MGKSLKKLVLAVLILVASDAAVIAQDSDTHRKVDFYGSFDGRWEGKFSRTPIPAFDPSPNTTPATDIAFSKNNTDVKVYLKPKGTWTEIKPGSFHIVSGATNAVVFSISGDIGTAADPTGWIETWNFTITHKERDSLYVFVTRAVNNYDRPSDYVSPDGKVSGRFIHILYGEMSRPAPEGDTPSPAPN